MNEPAIRYVSTRGEAPEEGFSRVVLEGLAPDGGLYVPARLPDARPRLDAWSRLGYRDLAFEVMRPFVDLPDDVLRGLVESSYAAFRVPEVAPVVRAGPVHLLELFHGPTLAFKDVALQFLGNLFEHLLERRRPRAEHPRGHQRRHRQRGHPRRARARPHPHLRDAPARAG